MLKGQGFAGTGVALVTPFTADGAVDHEALAAHVDLVLRGGVDVLVPCGTTGESATLSPLEQEAVVRTTVAAAGDRAPVLAGAGGNDTAEVVRRARAARAAGADGVLSVVPYYNKPPQEGLRRHFETVVEEGGLPVVLYDVPSRTACSLAPETVLRLAEHPGVVGIKEASGDLTRVSTLVRHRPEGFLVLSGDDELTLPLIALGGDGVISVVANVAPLLFSSLVCAARLDDLETARALHSRLLDLMRAHFHETNPIGVKTAVELLGGAPARLRLPLVAASAATRALLIDALATAGLGTRDGAEAA